MTEKMNSLEEMRKPFPPNQINYLVRSGTKLAFVGHAALTDRLLDVDPIWNWEFVSVGPDGYPIIDENGGMWIRLTVCGVTRLGYGDAQGKTGGNAMKERIGDALRNAAMRFGAALDLWHKGDLHAGEDLPLSDDEPPATSAPRPVTPFDVAKACKAITDADSRAKAERYADAAFERASSDEQKKVIADALKQRYEEAA